MCCIDLVEVKSLRAQFPPATFSLFLGAILGSCIFTSVSENALVLPPYVVRTLMVVFSFRHRFGSCDAHRARTDIVASAGAFRTRAEMRLFSSASFRLRKGVY